MNVKAYHLFASNHTLSLPFDIAQIIAFSCGCVSAKLGVPGVLQA